MEKKKNGKKAARAGSSMVEVLVAFLVVMLMMALFARAVTASVQLLSRSKATVEKTESFNEKYYMTAERAKREDVSTSLALVLDKDKTSSNNTGSGTITLALPKGKLQKYTDNEMTRYSISIEASDMESDGEQEQ